MQVLSPNSFQTKFTPYQKLKMSPQIPTRQSYARAQRRRTETTSPAGTTPWKCGVEISRNKLRTNAAVTGHLSNNDRPTITDGGSDDCAVAAETNLWPTLNYCPSLFVSKLLCSRWNLCRLSALLYSAKSPLEEWMSEPSIKMQCREW